MDGKVRVLIGNPVQMAERQVEDTVAGLKPVRREDDAGRAAAFADLADGHLVASYRLASAILGDHVEAEDAVHDAFVTAWRKWSSLRDPAKVEPWFHRIVVNSCRDRLRRSHRAKLLAITVGVQAQAADPFASTHDRDELDRALVLLSADDQVILALRFYLDLSVRDVAGLLGIRAGTAKVRLHRALGRLRQALAPTRAKETPR